MTRSLIHRFSSRFKASGSSLIEVMATVLLFSFALIGLVALQAKAVQFSVGAEDTNRAALLASDLAATMYSKRTVALTLAEKEAWQTRVADPTQGGLPNGTGDVEVIDGVAQITLSWKPPKAIGTATNRYSTQVRVLP